MYCQFIQIYRIDSQRLRYLTLTWSKRHLFGDRGSTTEVQRSHWCFSLGTISGVIGVEILHHLHMGKPILRGGVTSADSAISRVARKRIELRFPEPGRGG
jgi:hypothetical protein